MSLKELLEINKLVFGVSKPKISVHQSLNVLSYGPNSSCYFAGAFFEKNLENVFLYCSGANRLNYVRKTTSSTYYLGQVNFNDYLCLKDIFDRDNSLNLNPVGISLSRVQPIGYKTISMPIQIKDTEPKVIYTTTAYNMLYDDGIGIERFFIVEYDPDIIMVI